MYEDPKSKISQLEKVLDTMGNRVPKDTKRHELHEHEVKVSPNWAEDKYVTGEEAPVLSEDTSASSGPKGPKKMSFANKILIGSVIFFVIALGAVAYQTFLGDNLVSGNNIEVSVKAPISIAGGEVVPFEIEIKNNNSVSLLGTYLGVTFPLGAKEVSDTSIPAKRVEESLGDILPGGSVKKNLSVALFGAENEKKEISISLEYKVTGSNSLFNKTKTVSILVGSSPVSIVVTGPTEVNTNQTVNYTVDITSNSPSVVKGLLLEVTYPFGFSFVSSNPQTFFKNSFWLVGDLEPGAKRTVKFSGTLSGQEREERGFNFKIGSQSKTDNLVIETPFASTFSSVTIRRPFVSADIFFNGVDTSEYISVAGSKVETAIKWRNNLAYEVSDVSIVVKLSGNSFDKSAVQVEGGLYRSIDNTIVFNKLTDSDLANLEPGQEGASEFEFASFGVGTVTGAALSNPSIVLNISVTGKRVDYEDGQENVLFSDSRKIKITANPQLFAKALYYVGPFKNTGSIPPKAEEETTYTITWTVTNPLNNLSNAKAVAILPPYIKWLGVTSPSAEKLVYDEGTGSVVWNIGSVPAGAGTVSAAREASFQISFLPSVDQIGTSPNLIGETTLTAKDNFTLTGVTSAFSALNISLGSDPYFRSDSEKVAQ